MGTPLLVLSGGDPVNRPDLFDLIRQRQARTACAPPRSPPPPTRSRRSWCERASRTRASTRWRSASTSRAPQLHDAFRGVPGAFAKTHGGGRLGARRRGLPLQINTTVAAETAPYLEEMAALVEELGVVFWEVFFLVPVGPRRRRSAAWQAHECERIFDLLYRTQKKGRFIVKVTEAPHYRRHVAQRERQAAGERGRPRRRHGHAGTAHHVRRARPHRRPGAARRERRQRLPLRVAPRRDLPERLPAPRGRQRARRDDLADAYRDAQVFRALRDPDRLTGRCGRCEYRSICGGSRSRALALTGDLFATDPWCVYEPPRTALSAGRRRPCAGWWTTAFEALASLQLAVVTMGALGAACIAATFYESAHGTAAAQRVFYRSAWFTALLAVLAANVLFSALKRYPWNRHHVGFVLAHAGILLLLGGSLVSLHAGLDGRLTLAEGETIRPHGAAGRDAARGAARRRRTRWCPSPSRSARRRRARGWPCRAPTPRVVVEEYRPHARLDDVWARPWRARRARRPCLHVSGPRRSPVRAG